MKIPKFSIAGAAKGAASRSGKSGKRYIKQFIHDRLQSNMGILGSWIGDKTVGHASHKGRFDPERIVKKSKKRSKLKATEVPEAVTESSDELVGDFEVIEQAINHGNEAVSLELDKFSDEIGRKLEAMANELEAIAYAKNKDGDGGEGGSEELGIRKKAEKEESSSWLDTVKSFLTGAFVGRLASAAMKLKNATPLAAILGSILLVVMRQREAELADPAGAQAFRDRNRGGRLLDPNYSGTTQEVERDGPLKRKAQLTVTEIKERLEARGYTLQDLDTSRRRGNIVYLKNGKEIDLSKPPGEESSLPDGGTVLPEVTATQDEQTFDADMIEFIADKEICFEEDGSIQGDDSIPRGTTQGADNRNNQATNMRGIGNPQMGVKDSDRLEHAHSTFGGGGQSEANKGMRQGVEGQSRPRASTSKDQDRFDVNKSGFTAFGWDKNPSNLTQFGFRTARINSSDSQLAKDRGYSTAEMQKERLFGVKPGSDYNVFYRSTGNPLVSSTVAHEATHYAADSVLDKNPDIERDFPETKDNDFEELRQRLSDKTSLEKRMATDPNNPALTNAMRVNKDFIDHISSKLGGSDYYKVVQRAKDYESRLNNTLGNDPWFQKKIVEAPHGFNSMTGAPNPTGTSAELADRSDISEGAKSDNVNSLKQLSTPAPPPAAPPSSSFSGSTRTAPATVNSNKSRRKDEEDSESDRTSYQDMTGTGLQD